MIEIREERPPDLAAWSSVPIRFAVRSRFRVRPGTLELVEERVEPAYEYDYDALEPPVRWREWDLSGWGFLAAFDGGVRAGAAAIAMCTPGLGLLEGRGDLAALWDIRVRPEHRGKGVGKQLFEAALAWARDRGASELRVETQDINVPACRFYGRRGCRLAFANPGAYAHDRSQVQLLWALRLDGDASRPR